ncbi:MAG: glycosyltransferase family 9 protein, partial [Gemmatimonadaceae bacterium]|nr:glycosyltransferase family 9 protein [Gemmatimonadaceae bacterium]
MSHRVPPRVGIVLMSALGDVTLGLPVATALKRARPDVRITWVAQRGPDALVRDHPAIDTVVPFDRHGGWRAYAEVRRRLAAAPVDAVLDLQVAIKAGLVTALWPAAQKWGIDRARARDANWLFTNAKLPPAPRRHMADQFLEFAHALGADPEPLDYGLRPSAAALQWRDATIGPGAAYAVLVLASSAAHKNWFAERWTDVARHLVRDHGLRVVLAGATSDLERDTAETIRRAIGDAAISTLGSGIENLLAVLAGAALVISPDTGPLHMAVALGRPVIGLYGSTNPKWVGPYRGDAVLLVDRYGEPGEAYASSSARR